MPTIGMPKVKIAFESAGLTAIQRSETGIVLLLIKGTNPEEMGSYKFTSLIDLPEDVQFSEETIKLIKLGYEAHPRRMLVEVYGDNNPLKQVLAKLQLMKFNYYAAPNATEDEIDTIKSWHMQIVNEKDKTIKFVGFDYEADHETVINWSTPRIVYDDKEYTGQESTALIASQLAALPLTRSFTYFSWPLLTDADLPYAEDEDKAVNEGRLFLTYNGEKYKIARGVNSLTTYNARKGEDFSKIKIVDSMHLIKDDIRDTWNEFYVGKILNTYENKMQFIALINRVYFVELRNTVLENSDRNKVDIDVAANMRYAIKREAKVDEMTNQQIREFNTGSNVFLDGYVSMLDAMEDLYINFWNE
ncbi:phage tail sheath C-terminal domain-containing protein [Anaerococcus sp. Marseille-Q5996]|uniref:phage tail sheath C-terminal domain-containing protein n=1 Tax=Anaerococcus sp. Marseille-Q5996 TaxID=2972769 RepID=UPI0021C61150|nr:phage tail sheath C-terminal domain-containing protein [Anaerococcus sp. Marseille-Q5996]